MYDISLLAKYTKPKPLTQPADTYTKAFIKGNNERQKTSNPRIHHFSRSRLGILERIVASTLAVGTMLIPILILYLFDLSRGKIAAVVGCFVLLFMGTLSVFVEVTPHDLFLGVAA
jgi:hypothetical protein